MNRTYVVAYYNHLMDFLHQAVVVINSSNPVRAAHAYLKEYHPETFADAPNSLDMEELQDYIFDLDANLSVIEVPRL